MKILIQNRSNAFTHQGGDSVIMEILQRKLTERGHTVVLDTRGDAKIDEFDVLHLFNFTLPRMIEVLAKQAHKRGVPFVITTMNENVPLFLNQSTVMANFLIEYVERNQDKDYFCNNFPDLSRVPPAAPFDNSWAAKNAKALITTGEVEAQSLRYQYGNLKNIHKIKLGKDLFPTPNKDLFIKEYGVEDFILCVGRIESRKNQLMLLKALEDSELPVVLAGGGFTYQEDYYEAVAKFKRRGKTLILGRLSDEMMASAYAAARVHALVSWYELPGIVSLEAAGYGCNIVVTRYGTTEDYFENEAFYCMPADPDSILNAVLAAYYSPFRERLNELLSDCNWDNYVSRIEEIYENAVNSNRKTAPRAGASAFSATDTFKTVSSAATAENDIKDTPDESIDLAKAEELIKNKEFAKAEEVLDELTDEDREKNAIRYLRARGVLYLAQDRASEALKYFTKAYTQDPEDTKALTGLGMCYLREGQPERAYPYLVKACKSDIDDLMPTLQLIQCAYLLDRYEELEEILREYTEKNPDNLEMLFCYAGCLYKLGRHNAAKELVDRILTKSPNHIGAKELLSKLEEENSAEDSRHPISDESDEKEREIIYSFAKDSSVDLKEEVSVSKVSAKSLSVEDRIATVQNLKKGKKFKEAIIHCDEILAGCSLTSQQKAYVMCLKAESLCLIGEVESSQLLYEQILEDSPMCARAIAGQGVISLHKGEIGKAKEMFKKALSYEKANDIALAGLGICAQIEERTEDAFAHFKAALSSNPENTRALLGLIEVGRQLGREVEMEEYIRNYLEMHPADLNFVYSLAGCLYAQGKLEDALREVEKILLLQPSHKEAVKLREDIENRLSAS